MDSRFTFGNIFDFRFLLVAVVCGIAGSPMANGLSVALDLGLAPQTATTNRLNVTVSSSFFSDSDLTRVSGNILASVGFDIVGGLPRFNALEFTGGQLSVSGSETPDINLLLGASFNGVNITGSGVGGEFDTPSPPGTVSGGSFPTEQHVILLNRGTIVARGTGFFSSVDENIDLSQDPLSLTQVDTGSLSVTQTGVNGRERTFEVTLEVPVDAMERLEGSVSVDVDVLGRIVARDSFTITFPLEGDYNGDLVVDAADYTVWRDSLGAAGTGLAADGNFDLIVDHSDYDLWKSNFGESAPAAAGLSTATVPEPTTVVLLCVALTAIGATLSSRRMG